MTRTAFVLASVLAAFVALAASPVDAQGVRFKLVVDAPDPPRAALAESLDLARWQADEEMTLDLLERLARESVAQAVRIAAVHGFYDAKARVAIDRNAQPLVVTLTVDPGAPTRVRSVAVDVVGPAANDVPLGTQAIAEARGGWRLPVGERFRQAGWIEAKESALRELRRSPYAAARILASEARVDPQAHAADLEVRIDSGPPFRFGDLAVSGLQRYDESLVANFNVIEPGEPYTEAARDQYVRRLSASGYFGSVQASIDPQSRDPARARIDVSAIEGPVHRLDGALAYSTDTGFGARATYTNVSIDDAGMQMRLDGRLETKEQLARATLTRPPSAARRIDSLAVGAERSDIENTIETTAGVEYERRGVDERDTPVLGASFHWDRQEPQGAPSVTSHATYVQAGWVRRRVDDLYMPTRGYMVDARVGAGIPGLSTRGFGRARVQAAAWWPIGRATQLAFRGEAGAVIASERDGIPSLFLFRTGGDTTVRGYGYQSLGLRRGDATVGARYVVVGSAEAIRWIDEAWGVAAFVDVGDAFDRGADFDAAIGVGVGARIRTPIGPFRLDVAYGERTREVRLHFSVGVSF
ncbi:MAG: BamA/TamA family outer membrane protein [Betaproteobacteria bacterium]|nr:BamA/TamA family outer membrane protein [Betaproteobacteria bacterium]